MSLTFDPGCTGGAKKRGYRIGHSLRLRAAASGYLNRTPAATAERLKWTWSGWVKRGQLGVAQTIFSAGAAVADRTVLYFNGSDQLAFIQTNVSVNTGFTSSSIFRDPTAHYHIVVHYDSANAVAADRCIIYVNGVRQAGTVTAITQNYGTFWHHNVLHRMGLNSYDLLNDADFLLSEVHDIGDQLVAPSAFAEENADGVWVPKKYEGTYGAQGFYLPFSDGSSIAALGNDASPNNNDWTLNNISITPGATYDWLTDTPTNNYATLNPLQLGHTTLTNCNLTASGTGDAPTIVPASGTWYFERNEGAQTWTPPAAFPSNASGDYNFGQRPFTGTPTAPTLCTENLPAVTVVDPAVHFDTHIRAGTGVAANITGKKCAPDFVWVKNRGAAAAHHLMDRVRGIANVLFSDASSAQANRPLCLTALNADGYSLGTGTDGNVNTAANTYVDWFWRGGGVAAANNAGSIASQVSANVAAGFSVVTFTGTGAAGTIGHGLGVVPKLIILKHLNAVNSWPIYHADRGATKQLVLNDTLAETTATTWNNTAPTSAVFSVGAGGLSNVSGGTYVAYCFAEVPGYSKFGSYVGNGAADGPFVHCGFNPKFVLFKNATAVGSWNMQDTERDPNNLNNIRSYANLTNAEATNAAVDFLANGFKLRGNVTDVNGNGNTIVFAAFAEHPFGGSNVAPSPAR